MKRFTIVWMAMILLVIIIGSPTTLAVQQATQIQPRHSLDPKDENYEFWVGSLDNKLNLNKHTLTLSKGATETLKVTTMSGKKANVTWKSSNPKIAKISQSGKVTAVAPGITKISVCFFYDDDDYGDYYWDGYEDATGRSNICHVTVQGSSKDPKPFNLSDETFYYNKTSLKIPAWTKTIDYSKTLTDIKNKIGGTSYKGDSDYDGLYDVELFFGSTSRSKAHTRIFYRTDISDGSPWEFGYIAKEKSPIKTVRGIKVGSKKGEMQNKYGLPLLTDSYKSNGNTYEWFLYETYTNKSGATSYMSIMFTCLKSKGTVTNINFLYSKRTLFS